MTTHRPCLISDQDILDPPKLNIYGRCYRQLPVKDADTAPELFLRGEDKSQFQDDDEEEDEDGIVEEAGVLKLEIQAADLLFKFVIGKRGETKHKIESETRTQISIPKQGVSAPIVIKSHDRASLLSAKTRIELLLETSRWKLPFTHFLSFKLSEADVIDGFIQFRTDVLEVCKGDRGIDDTIFQQPNKLHLTLGTLVLLDEREVTAASQLLHQCLDSFIADILDEGELNVDVEGLEYMNDDPYNVDVLYAKVQLTDQSNRLQSLADQLVAAFVDAGYMERQYDRVKLHCTVMNSIFRSDSTGMRLEPKREDQANNAKQQDDVERQPFDADHLLKKLGKFHFGNLTLNELHISTRYTADSSGYYRPAAKIKF